MKVGVVALLLASCTPYQLHHANRIALGATVALTACDWGQTSYAAARPQMYEETNQMLGAHPSQARVAWYMSSAIAGVLAVTLLPEWLRPTAYMLVGAAELSSIGHNMANAAPVPICGLPSDAATPSQ